MLALKSGLNDGPGLCALVLPGSNAPRGVFDDPAASVTLYLWSRTAFLIELEYESHRCHATVRLRARQLATPHCAGMITRLFTCLLMLVLFVRCQRDLNSRTPGASCPRFRWHPATKERCYKHRGVGVMNIKFL